MFPFFTLCPRASELDEPDYRKFLPFYSVVSDFLFSSLIFFLYAHFYCKSLHKCLLKAIEL